jgi:hypothetical protein
VETNLAIACASVPALKSFLIRRVGSQRTRARYFSSRKESAAGAGTVGKLGHDRSSSSSSALSSQDLEPAEPALPALPNMAFERVPVQGSEMMKVHKAIVGIMAGTGAGASARNSLVVKEVRFVQEVGSGDLAVRVEDVEAEVPIILDVRPGVAERVLC